ncbi:uncharacterized protein LOC125548485 [Triticum urartu]|uniref:uncharacterized protein LOC125548484 n=1 Tax=Triticum urartu TaxID=4572 RepID=UPI0020442E4F|nr:uncharacterized protein LOC125548484 [Triticum urartu]XP_048568026.1 uncharacterized protein LOC125548485 [Triticum urartu]
MPSARTAPSPSAPALLGRPWPSAWSPGTCCSAPAPAGGRRPPRRLWPFAPTNPGAARLLGRTLSPKTCCQQTTSRLGQGTIGFFKKVEDAVHPVSPSPEGRRRRPLLFSHCTIVQHLKADIAWSSCSRFQIQR